MNIDLGNKYCAAMEVCVQHDDHDKADALLRDLLCILGYQAVCELHSKVKQFPRPITETELVKAIETSLNRKSKK